jgi:hypothetical protein
MANESFLIIVLSLYPHPKGRLDARGASTIGYLIMVTYPAYAGRSGHKGWTTRDSQAQSGHEGWTVCEQPEAATTSDLKTTTS